MKKFILLILLIGVNCNCGVSGVICSSPGSSPKGSYTETCSNICYDSKLKTLKASCTKEDGTQNNTSLITEASDTNIDNNNGDLRKGSDFKHGKGYNADLRKVYDGTEASVKQQQQLTSLQQLFPSQQKQLAATPSKDYLKKIELNLQILQLNCRTNQSSCLSNLQIIITAIQSLLPNPVPHNLQNFANYVKRLQTIYNQNSFQSLDQNSFQSLDQMGINMGINSLLRWAQQLQRPTEAPKTEAPKYRR